MKILLVEDDPKVALFIREGLEDEGYEVDLVYDGQFGKRYALKNFYDIVLLDIILPYIDGIALCREIRHAKPEMPIIFITALDDNVDKIRGFNAGADDYMVKPFEFNELLARIRAITNRAQRTAVYSDTLRIADLLMDINTKTVTRGDTKIELTAKEFQLLEFFIKNKDKVLSRDEIAEKVWDLNFDPKSNIVDVYVNYLRKKIDKDFAVKLIHTSVGFGYIFKEE